MVGWSVTSRLCVTKLNGCYFSVTILLPLLVVSDTVEHLFFLRKNILLLASVATYSPRFQY